MLYLPVNILPIMVTDLLEISEDCRRRFSLGSFCYGAKALIPSLAVGSFWPSIMLPTLKMIAIAWLCWDAKGHSKRDSERITFDL